MRKVIIAIFLCIGITSGVVIYNSAATIVPDILALPAFDDLPIRVQESIVFIQNNEPVQLEVSFSHTDHFYDKTIHVSISANNPGVAIYYTIDGSQPTEASMLYSHPLELTAEEDIKGTVLKAVAINDTEQSPVLTHSYFVGTSIDERFSTYVFSISTDADGLYGYDYGILVPGRIHDDYLAETPEEDLLRIWEQPANYIMRGRQWERPVHVEVLTQEGKRVIAQNAGMRVNGGVSRTYNQKSLRLIARKDYEPGVGSFHYDFFSDYSDIHNKPIISHDTLILRNDGNDNWQARIRTPLASTIAKQAGYKTISPQASAAVFINGEYYGFAWINIRMNEHFLENLYDTPERAFDIEPRHDTRTLRTYAENGFNDEDRIAVNAIIDVNDLLLYYAIQTYISNDDWPENNIAMWRYTGDTNVVNITDELDGRWRYLMWDLDRAMNHSIGSTHDAKSIHRLVENDRNSFFQAILQHPEYMEIYANHICDMIFEHFSVLNVERVKQELNDASFQEQKKSLEFYGRSLDALLVYRDTIIDFFNQRPDYIMYEIYELFGLSQLYRIQSDGSVKINTLNGNEGFYFIENQVPVYQNLEKGYVFDHWLINGEKRYGEELFISYHDADANGIVYVQAIAYADYPPLFFRDTFDTGTLFGFTMYNPNNSTQSTRGLYLSDNIENLKKWQFPYLNVRPGRALEFVGRNSTSPDALLKIGLSFNPRHGDAVFLSNEDGVILDRVFIRP
ncbi:MAG: CotH kinase family protein [Oscillospiraceae bacterium]|jgi:hypothetical protein|nr:CotH kinase family protein [Oscillospiraceae bacterium]